MSKSLIFLSLAFVLFAAAASLSWYLQYQQQAGAGDHVGEEDKSAKKKHALASIKAGGAETFSSGPIIRPPESPEAARVMKFADTLKKQEDLLKEREGHLVLREKQMGMIHEEIKKDQQKLVSIRKEVQTELQLVLDKLDVLEKKTAAASAERQKIKGQLDALANVTLELDQLENKNVQQMAMIYDKMEPDAAATSIIKLADSGKLDTAVLILANMTKRQAAGVLGEINLRENEALAVQIAERMRYLKTPAPPMPK